MSAFVSFSLFLCLIAPTFEIAAARRATHCSSSSSTLDSPEAPPAPSPAIIGGTQIDISEFPHVISLRFLRRHRCGASVLSAYWALTAAHCLYGELNIAYLSFAAGVTNRSDPTARILAVAEYHLHPNYDPDNYDFDVAVARGNDTFEGPNIVPIPLATQGMPYIVGLTAQLAGWGIISDGSQPDNLYTVEVPFIDFESCRLSWTAEVTDNMLCAGTAGKDACAGDSGGPLIFCGIQVGISSWGASICGTNLPSVYTNIADPQIRAFIRMWTGI